ncbi:MAP7 domain-containing protein 2 isoform X2 [Esox lucius]|uniref:MAP7 domain-containing protein 2 isoform X2 n=1 Tax=Esox lucius TaxID=8010 RepID=UPI0009732B97|nr:MAP7 domain-containing protein 2 isoform X2 [Esox lucius]
MTTAAPGNVDKVTGMTSPTSTRTRSLTNGHLSPLRRSSTDNSPAGSPRMERVQLVRGRREEREKSQDLEKFLRNKDRRLRQQLERSADERWRRMEEQKKREEERRAAVEDRRRQQEDEEKVRGQKLPSPLSLSLYPSKCNPI